jgi:hypothetical protein
MNLKISTMTPASALDGTELVAGLQGGGNVSITTQDIADLAGGGGSLLTTKVTVSSSELLNLGSAPKTLIAAPGAGNLIVPITCILVYKYGTVDYAGTVNLALSPNNTLFNVTFNSAISGNSNRISTRTVAATATTTFANGSTFDNVALTLGSTGNPTTGDGTLDVYLSYYIIDNMT